MLARLIRATFIGVLFVVAPDALGAEAKTSPLSWLRMLGADECVATQTLARAVEERLGRAVFVSASQADLSVEGRIEKRPARGWHAVITVRDAGGTVLGTRQLDRSDTSCETMTEPLALVIAVMIDPDAAMRPKPAPVIEAETTPPTLPTAHVEPEPESHPPPPKVGPDRAGRTPVEPWRFEGHVTATVHHGSTPTLAPGAGVQGILYPPVFPVGLRGYANLFLPTETEQDGARASFDMLYGGGSLCPTLRGRVHLLGCVGGQIGVLRPRAETPNRGIGESLLPILNAVVELRVHGPIVAPFGAAAGVSAGLPIMRPEVEYGSLSGRECSVLADLPSSVEERARRYDDAFIFFGSAPVWPARPPG